MAYKDGIVNSVIFSKTTPKILWILKEVNHNGDLENWNFTKILQDLKTDCGIEKGFERTFAPPLPRESLRVVLQFKILKNTNIV